MRIALACFVALYLVHLVSPAASSAPASLYKDDPTWQDHVSSKLGLDHYAAWEKGLKGHLRGGAARVKDGLSTFKGAVGWVAQGAKLGSLYAVSFHIGGKRWSCHHVGAVADDRVRLLHDKLGLFPAVL